jgi:subfamily B ATP-binding cassette protein MsbA
MVLVAATSTFHVWLVQPALDEIFLRKDSTMLIYIPLAVLVVAFIKAGADYGQRYLMRYVGQRVITDLQMKLYAHLLYADLEYLYKHSSGQLISRFTNDINIMRGAVSNVLTGIAKESLTVVFLVALMLYQTTVLSLVAFIVFPVAILPIIKMGRRMRKISGQMQNELGKYTARLDESFHAIRVIKSYRREEFEIKRANHIIENIFTLYRKAIRTDALTSPIMEMLSGIAIAAVIWYGGMQVISGTTTPGNFFSFIVAFIAAYKPVKSLADLNTSLQDGLAAAARVFEVLDTIPKIKDKPGAITLKVEHGEISFQEVSFSYPDGTQALDQINLLVPSGKTIALVGPSGGGKTTITSLLLRFFEPQQGKILIDRQNINEVTLASLLNSIAIVTQDVTLLDDTIRANIAYGRLDATDEEIIQAARSAAADEFIQQLPFGYDSMVGQNGVKLSGGQRQRISIARAILKNSPILILDEATAALDNLSEENIQQALSHLRHGRTTIVIAHRLSTIVNADLICVIKHGNIVESGTHQQLLSLHGEYHKLYKEL